MVIVPTAIITGLFGFACAMLMGDNVVAACVLGGGVVLIMLGYLTVFLHLRVLNLFPRPAERFIDRMVGPSIAGVFAANGLLSNTNFVGKVFFVVAALAMGIHLSVTRKRVTGYVTIGVVHPRNRADVHTMLRYVEIAEGRRLNAQEAFFARLNKAHALIALDDDEHVYERLHEAYEILHRLAAAPAPAPHLRVSLAATLTTTAGTLHLLGDDLHLFEHAARLRDQELARADWLPAGKFHRLVNMADLHFARSGLPGGINIPDAVRIEALQEALRYTRAAQAMAPPHFLTDLHVQLAVTCAALGRVLADEDLVSEAIGHARRALDSINRARRERRPNVQLMLAELLLYRGAEFGGPTGDLFQAEYLANAVRSSDDLALRGTATRLLITTWRMQESVGISPTDVPARLAEAQRLLQAITPFARVRLDLAVTIGIWAAEQDRAYEAAWAFSEALTTARRLSATGLMRRQQQAPLREAVGIAAEAAHWLLECGRPHEAVVALESSRALVLSAAVHREMLVRRLERWDPNLAHRCAQLSAQLARVDRISRAEQADSAALWRGLTQRQMARTAHDEWRKVVAHLNRWPEFRALLDAPGYAHVTAAARHQTLIYVLAAEATGYALVVMPHATAPIVVRLPHLTNDAVSQLARRFLEDSGQLSDPVHARTVWRPNLANYLDELNKAVMTPLTTAVRLCGAVTIIPVGELALLPLHAAGDERRNDDVAWSYAPSGAVMVHAVEAARMRPLHAGSSALLVASAGSVGQELQFTTTPTPVLRRHLRAVTAVEAARDAILAVIGQHDVCHFSCHGAADGVDPLESRLELDDGQITVRDLLDRRLRARLVVLAACETGVPYAPLPDESIGLPAALLEAGVPGVVSTLWQVEELPTALLTARFYQFWLGDGRSPAAALGAAQRWLRDSTIEQFEAYLANDLDGVIIWPRRHSRKARQHRIFADPDYWAAFIYTGV